MESFPEDFKPLHLFVKSMKAKEPKLEVTDAKQEATTQRRYLDKLRKDIFDNASYAASGGFTQASTLIPDKMSDKTLFLLCEELRKNFNRGGLKTASNYINILPFSELTSETDLNLFTTIFINWESI